MLAAKPALGKFPDDKLAKLFASLEGERHITLAVSGGSDSMAMLRLAARLPDKKISALTVDHGLRAEAASEALQVAAWCSGLAIDHCTLRWEGTKPKSGVQAKARVVRYDLMSDWCRAHGVNYLLTAHTMDDQAETVLMRQQRTSTLESLAGIWETSAWNGVKLFRPLLGQSRSALRSYLIELGQPWIDDPSNEDVTFERVRVRQALALEPENSRERLADIATGAGEKARALATAADLWLHKHLPQFPEGYGAFPRTDFGELPRELQRRVLQQAIQTYGAGSRADPHELDYLSAWIVGGTLTRKTLGGAILAGRQSHILIGREWSRIGVAPIEIPRSGEVLWDGRFQLRGPANSKVVAVGSLKGLTRRKDLPNFVQQGLPAVILPSGSLAIPHLGVGKAIDVKFMGCLR